MSQLRTLVRGALLSAGGMFAGMAAMVLVGKIITVELTEAEVGAYVLLLLLADCLNLATSFGLGSSLPALTVQTPPAERARFVAATVWGQCAICVGVSLLLLTTWGMAPAAWFEGSADWSALYPWAWALPVLYVAGTLRDHLLATRAGLDQYRPRAIALAGGSLVYVALAAVGIVPLGGGFLALLVATFVAAAFTLCALSLPWPRPSLVWRPGDYRHAARESIALYINSLLAFVFQRLDTLLVSLLLGIEAAAIFEMVKRLAMMLSRTFMALLVPFLPQMAGAVLSADRAPAVVLLNQATRLTGFLAYAAALLLIALQEIIVRLLFTESYLAGLTALVPLLAATALGIQTAVFAQTLISLRQSRHVTISNIGSAILSLGLNLLLIPQMGLAGAGVAALVSTLFAHVLQVWYVQRHGMAVEFRPYLWLHLSAALCLGLAWFAQDHAPTRYAAPITFVALCLVGRVFTVAECKSLFRTLLPFSNSSAL